MQTYIATKIVQAEPNDEAGVPGYKVVYQDGYESWCPKDVFEKHNQPTTAMDFGHALVFAKMGLRVARAGWNGKGMWITWSPGFEGLPADRFFAPANRAYAQEHGPTDVLGCFTMKTADGKILMGWLASQTDMVAEDWMIVI